MLRVCHFSSHHSSTSVRILKKQCISLAKHGYEVYYVVAGEGSCCIDDVTIEYVANSKGIIQRLFVKPYKVYKKAKKIDADIYHFHDPELLFFALLLKAKDKKIIYDIHEDLPGKIRDFKNNLLFKSISYVVSFFEKLIAKRFDVLITVNDDIEKKFKHPQISVINNYPIINLFKDNIREKNNSTPIIVYSGLINKIRGIKEIIDAVGKLEGKVIFVLIGNFQSAVYKEVCQKSEGWKYTDYKGFLKIEEAYSLVQQSDIGIINFLPNENHLNSMPNKVFEYMAAGLPMILSGFPYWRNLFSDYALFTNPLDTDSISKKIMKLAMDKKMQNRFATNARNAIINQYSWEAESKKLIAIYNHLYSLK